MTVKYLARTHDLPITIKVYYQAMDVIVDVVVTVSELKGMSNTMHSTTSMKNCKLLVVVLCRSVIAYQRARYA